MHRLQFNAFTFSGILISLLLGAIYAFILYQRRRHFPVKIRRWLFAVRMLSVAAICFLLFAPLIKISETIAEKPLIIVAQDNSASLAAFEPAGFDIQAYSERLRALQKKLSDRYEVRSFTVGEGVREAGTYTFRERATDLSALFSMLKERFAGRNIGAVILASDGIYNRGGNPRYEARELNAPVYTVALGDTLAKKDLLIAAINYNTIVYSGNDFQAEISMEAYQSRGVATRLTISDQSGQLFTKTIAVTSDEFSQNIPVVLPAGKKGFHRFKAELAPVSDEISAENNTREFFVEVLEGKQKVYILANAPHPDISAMKQSISSNNNYEVQNGLASEPDLAAIREADLLILHQLPSDVVSLQTLRPVMAADKPVLFILGARSDMAAFSAAQNLLEIRPGGAAREVTAAFNNTFYSFVLTDRFKKQHRNWGQIMVPMGSYRLKSPASVLLYQQDNNTVTDRPLLLFSEGQEKKTGILTGEGLWRWRLSDFRDNGDHRGVDELLTRIIQYLSAKEDKRKFRAYPARSFFDEGEQVVLHAELYNDAYELINTPDVQVVLKNDQGRTFPFLFTRSGNSYMLDAGVLPAGGYTLTAETLLGDRKYTAGGQFVVVKQEAELKQTRADHRLLYTLARQGGGHMVYPGQVDSLYDMISKNELVKTVSYDDSRYEELLSLKWICALIIALLSAEWFGRKRSGDL